MFQELRWEKTSGCRVGWVFNTTNMTPSFWTDGVNNVGNSVSNVGLESSWTSYEPIEDNGPSKNRAEW